MRSALFLAVFAVAAARGGCDPTEPPYDPCAAKRCGDDCRVCPPGDAGCFETAVVKGCDAAGQCVPAPVACAPNGCEGQPCGHPCTLTPPCDGEVCPAIAMMGACDGVGACVTPEKLVCLPPPPPFDPCAGKRCGEACSTCSPTTETFCPAVMLYCDLAGACGPAYPVCRD